MSLDILIFVVLGAAAIFGAIRGAIAQIASIVGLVAGIVSARLFGMRIADFFAGSEAPGAIDCISGHIVAFVAAYLLGWVIVRVFRKVVHAAKLGIIDRILGAVLKVFIWSLVLSLAFNVYLIIKDNGHALDAPGKPWRTLIIRVAPATLGYIQHFHIPHRLPLD